MLRPCHPFQEESEGPSSQKANYTETTGTSEASDRIAETSAETLEAVSSQEARSTEPEETSEASDPLVETSKATLEAVTVVEVVTPPAECEEGVAAPVKSQEASVDEPGEEVAENNADSFLKVSELVKPAEKAQATEVPEPIKPIEKPELVEQDSKKGQKNKGKGKGKGKGKNRRQR
jgi:hypothetical protein